ncbi:MAG: JAB domain-containing protein [Erythrobacter sp.]|nr:JAB domain-containing protein [Erythrobacter sp.]
MVIAALQSRVPSSGAPEDRLGAMIAYLRGIVIAPEGMRERGHAIFVDAERCWLGDTSIGVGNLNALSLRMRTLFGEALRLDARGIILAHNHPSGHCRPSGCDIAATRRLADVARALDIELIDHLIFTREAVYSMRAGGML